MRRSLLPALLILSLAPAAASGATVSGKIAGGKGYTVLALAPGGQSSASTAKANGAFSVKVRKAGSTLQLVRPDGSYFGPVVLGRSGRKAIVSLSSKGGRIGRVSLKKGFATAKAAKRAVTKKGALRTRANGAPYGAGKLGFVKLKGGKATARAAQSGTGGNPGGDPDADGIPSTFDADDNGNGSLDGVDPRTAAASTGGLFSTVGSNLLGSVNANAGGLTQAQIDAFVKETLGLNFFLGTHSVGNTTVSSVDVDCGALSYCRPGSGTAVMQESGNSPEGVGGRLWTSLDANGDGFPDVPANPRFGESNGKVYSMAIAPNATTADIRAGDLYQVRFSTPGGVINVPTALALYFASTPALAAYDGGSGPVSLTYPATQSSIGTRSNPLMMNGDKITLAIWRPQRAPIGDETGYRDMGHLRWGIPLNAGNRELGCGSERYSALSPTLAPADAASDGIYNQLFPLQDSADDAVPAAGNLLRFTFDLGGCLRANGIDPAGQLLEIPIQAVGESRPGGTDRTTQTVAVCLPGCTPQSTGGGGNSGGGNTGGGNTGGGGTGQGGMPDLALEGFSGSDNAGSCDIRIDLSNRGTVDSPATVTRVQSEGGGRPTTDDQAPTEAIAPGQHKILTVPIAGACGSRTVTVTADVNEAAAEYSESNNVLRTTFGPG